MRVGNLLRNKYKDRVKENGKPVMKTFASRAEYHRGIWLAWKTILRELKSGCCLLRESP